MSEPVPTPETHRLGELVFVLQDERWLRSRMMALCEKYHDIIAEPKPVLCPEDYRYREFVREIADSLGIYKGSGDE